MQCGNVFMFHCKFMKSPSMPPLSGVCVKGAKWKEQAVQINIISHCSNCTNTLEYKEAGGGGGGQGWGFCSLWFSGTVMLCKECKRTLSTSSLIYVKGRQLSCLIRTAWDMVGERWIEIEHCLWLLLNRSILIPGMGQLCKTLLWFPTFMSVYSQIGTQNVNRKSIIRSPTLCSPKQARGKFPFSLDSLQIRCGQIQMVGWLHSTIPRCMWSNTPIITLFST